MLPLSMFQGLLKIRDQFLIAQKGRRGRQGQLSHPVQFADHERTARQMRNNIMKRPIGTDIGVKINPSAFTQGRVNLAQDGFRMGEKIWIRAALCRHTGRRAFDDPADLDRIRDIFFGKARHPAPARRNPIQQTLRHQPIHGLPQRGARDAQLLRDRDFRQTLTGFESTCHNHRS